MTDIAVSIAYKVLGSLIIPILRQCNYLVSYKRHLNDLEEVVDILKAERMRVKHQMDEARLNGMVINMEILNWFHEAELILEHADMILGGNGSRRPKKFFYLDPATRYKKGRLAKKMMQELLYIMRYGDSLSYVVFNTAFRWTDGMGDDRGVYEALPSRDRIVKELEEAICDESVNVMGVCGVGGSGKTTLVKELIWQAKGLGWIDQALMVTVLQLSADITKRRIQLDIAKDLDLQLKDDATATVEANAAQLYRRLNNTNRRILIVMDDIWEALDLEELGIPSRQDSRIKILLTTSKSPAVLTQMGAQRLFQIGILTPEESWMLFNKYLGYKLEDSRLEKIVVEKTGGFPIRIRELAEFSKNAVIHKDVFSHQVASSSKGQLFPQSHSQPSSSDDYAAIENTDLSQISGSAYGSLPEEHKSLLHICALSGSWSHISIQDLFCHCMGLGLLQDQGTEEGSDTNIVQKAREKFDRLLQQLQASSSLLTKINSSNYVAIEDLKAITEGASRVDKTIIVIDDAFKLQKFCDNEFKDCHTISLLCDTFEEEGLAQLLKQNPASRLEFPVLKMFLIEAHKATTTTLPDSFFECMEKLEVLHLNGLQIPSSVPGMLLNLTTLCLNGCQLEDVAFIGNLQNLTVLTFRDSDITHLPKELAKVTKLRLLDVNGCKKLKSIQRNVLKELKNLEELYMDNFNRWGEDEVQTDDDGDQCKNAGVSELNHMKGLSCVDLVIPDCATTSVGLVLEKGIKYRIRIGDVQDWPVFCTRLRSLAIKLDSGGIPQWLNPFLNQAQDLWLYGGTGTQRNFNELISQSFHQLKHLHIQDCRSIQYIRTWFPCTAFSVIESLFLQNLSSLEKICCHDALMGDSLEMLRCIKIKHCGKLKNVFHFCWLEGLSHLEEIEISNCNMVEGVVNVEDHVRLENDDITTDGKVELLEVRRLTLENLPEFRQFCTNDASSSEIESDCAALFDQQHVLLPQLEFLVLSGLPKLKEIWSSQHSMVFRHLTSLQVVNCGSLILCIPSVILASFRKLESLTIESCTSIQHVFEIPIQDSLPRLKELTLVDLPNLMCIFKNTATTPIFSQLKLLRVEKCGSLTNLFSLTTAQGLGNVECIIVQECNKVDAIINLAEGENGVPPQQIDCPLLQKMFISQCPKMKAFSTGGVSTHYFFSPTVFLPRLDELCLESMESIEELWSDEVTKEESFLKLRVLRISRCKSLGSCLVPLVLMNKLKNLEEVVVDECGSLKVLISSLENNSNEAALILPKLHSLSLRGLHELTHIFIGKVDLSSLKRVLLLKCENVIYLFSNATARTLAKLDYLEILECRSMQQVIGEEGAKEDAPISFPHLHTLKLSTLIKLKCFSSQGCVFDFPCLETLVISECTNMKTFVQSDALDDRSKTQSLSSSHSLFNDKVVFPNLNNIFLCEVDMQKVWSDGEQLPLDSFSKLKSLDIKKCQQLETIAPSKMLTRLENLKKFVIEDCAVLKEIFQTEGVNHKDPTAGANFEKLIKDATFSGCPKLNYKQLGQTNGGGSSSAALDL